MSKATLPTGTNTPNPPPLVGTNLPVSVVPPNWVPDKKTVMEFVNYLWACGMHDQAAAFWDMYLEVTDPVEAAR